MGHVVMVFCFAPDAARHRLFSFNCFVLSHPIPAGIGYLVLSHLMPSGARYRTCGFLFS